ncbi:MAG: hypothetical protein ACXWYG_12280, partial [Aeromicrobium sp.]
HKIALAERDAQTRVEEAQTEAKRLIEQADVDARKRIAEAVAQAERLTFESKRDAEERLTQAVAAARTAAEERLQEAERTALEWVAAAEAEADRAAQAHVVFAGQSREPVQAEEPDPFVDEYVDEKPVAGTSANPEGVDGSRALAPNAKRVVRKK